MAIKPTGPLPTTQPPRLGIYPCHGIGCDFSGDELERAGYCGRKCDLGERCPKGVELASGTSATIPFTIVAVDVQPHPNQATTHPGSWAIKYVATWKGPDKYTTREFWLWHPTSTKSKPTPDEACAAYWRERFLSITAGFDFERLKAAR